MSNRNTTDKHLQNGGVVCWSRRQGNYVPVICPSCETERMIHFRGATERRFTSICFDCTRKQIQIHTADETIANGSVIYWSQRTDKEVPVKCGTCGQVRMLRTARVAGSTDVTGLCTGCARAGSKSALWKGGRSKHPTGYMKIRLTPDHIFFCMADKHRLVSEHRLVMAQHIGRPLEDHEVVHHKNGIKDDNRIENLELLTRRLHHTAFMPEGYENEMGVWNAIVQLVRSVIHK